MSSAEPSPSGRELDVSVIIPVLNVEATVGEQLDALARQDYQGSWEVLVADNGSTDATVKVAREFEERLPALRIVDASARRGINHARNAGARAARGRLLLFCDGDDMADPGWVRTLAAALATHEGAAGYLERDLLRIGTPGDPVPHSKTARFAFLPSPRGANCGVRREVWERLGGFDEDYDRGAADDRELFWRLQLEGGRLAVVPEAVMHYRDSGRLADRLRRNYRSGREGVRLHCNFRAYGEPAAPILEVPKAVAVGLMKVPKALRSEARFDWLVELFRAAGILAGMLRYRTLL